MKTKGYINDSDLNQDDESIWKPIDFESSYVKELNYNKRQFIENYASDKQSLNKIKRYCEKYRFDEQEIHKRIAMGDEFVINHFAIDPIKQSVHERTAAEYISKLPVVSNFEKLPEKGNGAQYVKNGMIGNFNNPEMKSIDFSWTYSFGGKELRFYASHKFTSEVGGGQDNQMYELAQFNRVASKVKYLDVYLFSISDGEYYDTDYTLDKEEKVTKLDFLSRFKGPRNMATTSNRLLIDMIPVIIDWLEKSFENPRVYKDEVYRLKKMRQEANLLYNTYQLERILKERDI